MKHEATPIAGGASPLSAQTRAAPRRVYLRRDLILLPCIFLLTWLFIGLAGEAIARIALPEQQLDPCHITESTGGRFRPDCHSRIKMFESAWVDNDYNDCGYRSANPCKARLPNALRVAVLGTSISRGYWVSYDQSFAGRVEHDLTAACKRPVDLQNVSQADSILVTGNGSIPIWHHVADRVPEALGLQPDALVLVMAPFDLASYNLQPALSTTPGGTDQASPASLRQQLARSIKTVKDTLANDSRLMLLARHVAFADPDRFVLHELGQGDSSDYLRQPFTANWLLRLKVADETIGRIQSASAGIPLIVVLMPLRAQAALSAKDADTHDTHPFALGQALAAIVHAHGAHFIDMTTTISTFDDPANLFFAVNGHPNAAGHAAVANSVADALIKDVPNFASSCGNPKG